MQASMEGVANASAWLEEEAADMGNKAPIIWVLCIIRDVQCQYHRMIQHTRYMSNVHLFFLKPGVNRKPM